MSMTDTSSRPGQGTSKFRLFPPCSLRLRICGGCHPASPSAFRRRISPVASAAGPQGVRADRSFHGGSLRRRLWCHGLAAEYLVGVKGDTRARSALPVQRRGCGIGVDSTAKEYASFALITIGHPPPHVGRSIGFRINVPAPPISCRKTAFRRDSRKRVFVAPAQQPAHGRMPPEHARSAPPPARRRGPEPHRFYFSLRQFRLAQTSICARVILARSGPDPVWDLVSFFTRGNLASPAFSRFGGGIVRLLRDAATRRCLTPHP